MVRWNKKHGYALMKAGITFIFLIALLGLLNCSGDNTENQTPKNDVKQSAPSPVGTQPTQGLHPDSHVSGTPSTHVSGAISTAEHLSGQ